MNRIKTAFALIVLLSLSLPLTAAAQYGCLEFYPNAPVFAAAGTDITDNVKIDAWINSGLEVSFTVGPKVGRFNLGVGLSMVEITTETSVLNGEIEEILTESQQDLGYVNFDLGFGYDFGAIHWQSYNLYQVGQNGVDNFILLRQEVTLHESDWGLFGHNIKCGDDDFQLFWGPSYNIGAVGPFPTNKLTVTVDLTDTGSLWSAYVIQF
ncbi:hypothetical protein HOB10_05590 [Candidatus Parcubacteria bacterium]|nr:hypothetical protein [Candidatus Parcubacteria bacterium]